jgi:hypothetical protein
MSGSIVGGIAAMVAIQVLGLLLKSNADKYCKTPTLKDRIVLRQPSWVYIICSLFMGFAAFFILAGGLEILDKTQVPKMPRAIILISIGLIFFAIGVYGLYAIWKSKLLITKYGIAEIYPRTLRMEDITKTRWFHKIRFSKIRGYRIETYYLIVDDGTVPKKIFSLLYKDIHKVIGVLRQKNL